MAPYSTVEANDHRRGRNLCISQPAITESPKTGEINVTEDLCELCHIGLRAQCGARVEIVRQSMLHRYRELQLLKSARMVILSHSKSGICHDFSA